MRPTTHIVIAERDRDLARTIALDLTADGHSTDRAATFRQLRDTLAERVPELLILGTLDTDQHELIHALRENRLTQPTSRIGIIALHPPGDDLTAPRLLRAGADDALSTPPDPTMLSARVGALTRRLHAATGLPRRIRVGTVDIDGDTRTVRVSGHRLDLSPIEFDLLLWLAADPVKVHTKQELLRDVWGYRNEVRTRTVDSHAVRLRHKLAHAGAPDRVINVWGVGYRLLDTDIETAGNGAA